MRALLESKHTVAILDDMSTGHEAFVDKLCVPLYRGDVGDYSTLQAAFGQQPVDAVLHVAGKALAGESVKDPAPYFRTNVYGPLTMLEAMRHYRVHRIVFSSTCATYGVPDRMPMNEQTAQRPISPYGSSKLAFEFALDAYRAYGIRSLALRYFNVAGASGDAEFGELHEPETHLIPNLLKAAVRGTPFTLFGTDYDTRDGTCERDYLHVEDLARAHVAAIERLDDLPPDCTALNLGTGRGCTVREMLTEVEAVVGRKVLVQECPRRPGDPPALVNDPTRAKDLLGFRCQHDLRAMVESAYAFMCKHNQTGASAVRNESRKKRFGELAVDAGYLSADKIERALAIQRERDGIGESHKLLGLILLEMGAISNEQLIETLQQMNG